MKNFLPAGGWFVRFKDSKEVAKLVAWGKKSNDCLVGYIVYDGDSVGSLEGNVSEFEYFYDPHHSGD